ncbi:MAG: porin [Roseovarius sp.]|nr:porin [Roseovarius sp.]
MKRTTLRTSAIALGAAVALPATAQEWNVGWGGYMRQYVLFGSTEHKQSGASLPAFMDIKVEYGSLPSGDSPPSLTDVTAGTALDLSANDLAEKIYVDAANYLNLDTAPNLGSGSTANKAEDITIVVVETADADAEDGDGNGRARVEAVNKSVDRNGGAQRRDTEIHFKPSVTLENGITFGAYVELEGDGAGVDESHMTISSDSLGRFVLGADDSMGKNLMVAAPEVTAFWTDDGIHGSFIPVYTGSGSPAAIASKTEVGGNNDVMRISYMTPSLGGLTLGVSYAADNKNNGNNSGYLTKDKANGNLSDILDLGLRFSQSLGEATVTLGARYGTAKQTLVGKADKKPREAGVGVNVGFGAFTLGGSYTDSQRYDKDGNDQSSNGFSLGLEYDMDGPWVFGINTHQGEWDNGDEHSIAKIGATRTLGTGVSWDLYAVTAKSERSTSTNVILPGTGGTDEARTRAISYMEKASGTLFGTAINLNF